MDLVLQEEPIWITVENLSVYVHKTNEGVVVDIFPLGDEMEDPITSTYAFFNEGKEKDL